jgi:large subunit ribosomal protein L6e
MLQLLAVQKGARVCDRNCFLIFGQPQLSTRQNEIMRTITANSPIQVRKSIRASTSRPTLTPGAVLILLAGRFRGKRVILLKNLEQGVLLVTGPFKVNGVPLRRVNSRYVIATSHKVDLSGIDQKKVDEVAEPKYFAREASEKKKGEGAFFKQGEKQEVSKIGSSKHSGHN